MAVALWSGTDFWDDELHAYSLSTLTSAASAAETRRDSTLAPANDNAARWTETVVFNLTSQSRSVVYLFVDAILGLQFALLPRSPEAEYLFAIFGVQYYVFGDTAIFWARKEQTLSAFSTPHTPHV